MFAFSASTCLSSSFLSLSPRQKNPWIIRNAKDCLEYSKRCRKSTREDGHKEMRGPEGPFWAIPGIHALCQVPPATCSPGHYLGREKPSLKASRIGKLDPRENRTRELQVTPEATHWSRAEGPAGGLGGRWKCRVSLRDTRPGLETLSEAHLCFSYTFSKNSPR